MDQDQRGRSFWLLGALAVAGSAYIAWLLYQGMLLGTNRLDGTLGVMLGLYICAQPAANGIDLIFFQRSSRYRARGSWSETAWLALNVLVLLIGLTVLIVGTTRFARGGD